MYTRIACKHISDEVNATCPLFPTGMKINIKAVRNMTSMGPAHIIIMAQVTNTINQDLKNMRITKGLYFHISCLKFTCVNIM